MIASERRETHIAADSASPRRRLRQISSRVALSAVALTFVTLPAIESVALGKEAPVVAASARPLALIENRRVLSYPLEQVWPAAIRYLKVDRGFEIDDHDREAGYILFEFPLPGQRTGSGSLEMFATSDSSGRPSVSLAANTGAGPLHLPNALLDGIASKVRAERGQPAAPPAPPKQPPEQDDPEGDKPEDDHSVPLMPPAEEP